MLESLRERIAIWIAPWIVYDDVRDYHTGDGYVTGTGRVLVNVHKPSACAGRACVIHAPSDHHMVDWPTNWRDGGFFDIKPPHMERVCPHGIGHPDPDDAAYHESIGGDISNHGCDGCCRLPKTPFTPVPSRV